MTRSAGRALVVGSAACRAHARTTLARTPYEFAGAEDAYSATAELCRRPLAYRIVILCLNSTYREELALITTVRRRFRHVDVYLAQTDGRHAALAEAVRLGAVGLLAEDGLHRVDDSGGVTPPPEGARAPTPPVVNPSPAQRMLPLTDTSDAAPPAAAALDEPDPYADDPTATGEAVLTADELRALLHEHPTLPPASGASP